MDYEKLCAVDATMMPQMYARLWADTFSMPCGIGALHAQRMLVWIIGTSPGRQCELLQLWTQPASRTESQY